MLVYVTCLYNLPDNFHAQEPVDFSDKCTYFTQGNVYPVEYKVWGIKFRGVKCRGVKCQG